MRQPIKNVSNTNQSNVTNTLDSAKTVFSLENSIHINSLLDMLEECVLHDNYNNVYTLTTLLRERLKPELFSEFGGLFNSLNNADHGIN